MQGSAELAQLFDLSSVAAEFVVSAVVQTDDKRLSQEPDPPDELDIGERDLDVAVWRQTK